MPPITDIGYDNKQWLLIDEVTQRSVKVADVRKDFRGEPGRINGGRAPHKPNSTGRVHVDGREFFPSVFGLKWIKV